MNVAASGCCGSVKYASCLSGIGRRRVQNGCGGSPMIRDRVCKAVPCRNTSRCDDICVDDERNAAVPGCLGERELGTSQVRGGGFPCVLERDFA